MSGRLRDDSPAAAREQDGDGSGQELASPAASPVNQRIRMHAGHTPAPAAAAAAAARGVAAQDDAADGGHGRSARAGRSLRDTIKQPPPSVRAWGLPVRSCWHSAAQGLRCALSRGPRAHTQLHARRAVPCLHATPTDTNNPAQNVITTFTRQPTPPRHLSRAERRRQAELQRLQDARAQRQAQLEQALTWRQQRELQSALAAAADGGHLTRHQTRLVAQWAASVPGLDADTVAAAALGDAAALDALAAAAAAAVAAEMVDATSGSGSSGERGGSSDDGGEGAGDGDGAGEHLADVDAVAGAHEEVQGGGDDGDGDLQLQGSNRRRDSGAAAAAAAAAGGAVRGLRGELLRLKEAAAELQAADKRR
jgi:hypothetical protein